MRSVAFPGSTERKQDTRDAQKVLRRLARKLRPMGFERTKPTYFIRPRPLIAEFVHVHKYSFAPAFRVHFGIRVRNDDFDSAALNGPHFSHRVDPESPGLFSGLEFTPDIESIEACANDLARLVASDGIRWFDSHCNPDVLLSPTLLSPLTPSAIAGLARALVNPAEVVTSPATRAVLNVA